MYSLYEDKRVKYLAVLLTLMVCTTRLSMAAGQIFYGLAIILGLLLFIKYHKQVSLSPEAAGYVRAVVIFFLSTLPATFLDGQIITGLKFFIDVWLYRFLVFICILCFIKQKHYLVKMLAVFFVVTNIDCLLALFQVIFAIDGEERGWGFGSNVLTLAGVMVMLFPMVLVIWFDEHFDKMLKNISKYCVGCIILGLLANKSRGSWLTLLITIPIVIDCYIVYAKKNVLICLVIILGLIGLFSYSQTYNQRLLSIGNITTDGSNADRIRTWQSTFKMIEDYPLLGVGPDQFRAYYQASYRLPTEKQNLVHAHNNYIQTTAENGIVGLFGLLYFVGYFLWHSFKNWHKDKNPYDLLIFLITLGYLVLFGQIEYTLDNSSGMRIFWFLLAILFQLKSLDVGSKDIGA